MLRVHSLVLTGTIAIDALETFFLTELQGNYIHVQLQSSGECLVPETSQVWDVLSLRHWVTQWRSWRKRCTGCVQGKWKGGWVSLHWKLAETTAWPIQSSKGETVWGHDQTSSGGSLSRWRKLEVYEFWFLQNSASLADLKLKKTF